MPFSPPAIAVSEAAMQASGLAHLARLAAQSKQWLQSVENLIPERLRPAIQAGPIDGQTWCLLVRGNAAAAKLRQVLPNIQTQLRARGCEVTSIRLHIQMPHTTL
jgi:Dna[CI] antecedent, DciA